MIYLLAPLASWPSAIAVLFLNICTKWVTIASVSIIVVSKSKWLYQKRQIGRSVRFGIPQLIPPLMRLGIRPGVGDLTVSSACVGLQVHSDLLMQLLNVLADDTYLPDNALAKFDMLPLIDYLKNVHVDLLNSLQLCGRHIRILISSAGFGPIDGARKFVFEEYSSEVSFLIEGGESKLIPFLSHLYELYFSPGYSPVDVGKIGESLSCSVSDMTRLRRRWQIWWIFSSDICKVIMIGMRSMVSFSFCKVWHLIFKDCVVWRWSCMEPLANEMAQEVRQRARKMAVQPWGITKWR